MHHLLTFFWDICLLRTGPDRAPTATSFLVAIAVLYFLTATGSLLVSELDLAATVAITIVLVSLLVEMSAVWLLLHFKGHRERFRATFVTLLGMSLVLSIVIIPFDIMHAALQSDLSRSFAATVYWLIFGWWLAVAGFIFHRAIEVSLLQGTALALTMEMVVLGFTAPLFT